LTHPTLAGLRLTSPPTYWRCEPGWSWHARPLPDHLLWYVLDGVGRLAVGDRRVALTAGTAVVFAPGQAPVAGHDPRRRLLVFGMHFLVRARPARVLPPGGWCRVRDQDLVAALARRCDSDFRRGNEAGALRCLRYLLHVLWEDSTSPAPGPVDMALDELVRVIRQDPARRWSVPELAARCALSRAQFTRRFTAYTGLPPARYLIQARVDRAHQLLTEAMMPVGRVAAALGYPDVASFSRQYRQYTGLAPSHSATSGSPATWKAVGRARLPRRAAG
jgi:AraC family transcriptional regulator, arabinose operon regulatory protein